MHRRRMSGALVLLCATALSLRPATASEPPYLHAPSVETYARHDPYGLTILPNGRFLKPAGRPVPVAKWPSGIALSPDQTKVFVSSDSVGQFVWNWTARNPVV